jgi:hypothetical protein
LEKEQLFISPYGVSFHVTRIAMVFEEEFRNHHQSMGNLKPAMIIRAEATL